MNFTTPLDSIPILLVDDRPENLLSLEALLADSGYELVRATSGNEALRLTLKHDFSLVLLDVQMPEMDGFETAELMRTNPKTRHIPIIFVTAGMKDLKHQFKGYDAGAVDYLAKPIEPAFLKGKVKIFTELYRQRREIELHRNHLEEMVEKRTRELVTVNEQLSYANRELKATEELLRGQVVEFVETHDQLLATEEMLRIQLEEYEMSQKLLNESNISLQTVFDVSPLAIIITSFPEGIIREINTTFTVSFGYTDEHSLGKAVTDLGMWDSNTEEMEQFFKLVQKQENISGFSTKIKTINGDVRSVLLYCTLIVFKNEKCQLTVYLDVTDQKRMEDQIRQTQKMDVVGQLAGGVAHDFNNMLTAIIGSAEMMETHVKGNESAIHLLGTIRKASSRSADLTSQLLAFSRKEQKNLRQVNLSATIQDVIALLERTIDKKIFLKTKLVARNANVIGDPTLLQNALLNLGVNARDAMPNGGIITFATTNVELDAEYCGNCSFNITPGSYIEISVTDTGSGMSEEIIKHVFEPFFTTKGIGKGTGLGLAAVYGTVTDHHGCISLFSEPGTGTVFKLYLPVTSDKSKEEAAAQELAQGSGGVLLVDDEKLLRDVGQALLETLGYSVYLAEDGLCALEIYAQEKENISLVILDIVMPRMGGREALEQLKLNYPDVRVLISSGFHQDETVDELKKLGARGFLQKPYHRHELSRAIAEALAENAIN